MIFCDKCGQGNPDDATYCARCGGTLGSTAFDPGAAQGTPFQSTSATGSPIKNAPPPGKPIMPPDGTPTYGQTGIGISPGAPPTPGQAPFGPPPGMPPYTQYRVPFHQETDTMAIASLALGIAGIFFYVCGVPSILAVVFGYKARSAIRNSGGRLGGDGLALAGIIIGWIGITFTVFFIVMMIVFLLAGEPQNSSYSLIQISLVAAPAFI
ncbi:MAG: DUF4190 domain-containing protein [Actinobacteria bacterium]|nr:DUF4190 domain-containing protein [Actinomycetota bacterium]